MRIKKLLFFCEAKKYIVKEHPENLFSSSHATKRILFSVQLCVLSDSVLNFLMQNDSIHQHNRKGATIFYLCTPKYIN